MKHLLLAALLVAGTPLRAAAQALATVTTPTHQFQYGSLLATQKSFKVPMEMQLDYGEGVGLSAPLAAQIKEEAAYVHTLTSIADGLNYLGLKGWEYLGFNSILLNGYYVHRYMLRRPVK